MEARGRIALWALGALSLAVLCQAKSDEAGQETSLIVRVAEFYNRFNTYGDLTDYIGYGKAKCCGVGGAESYKLDRIKGEKLCFQNDAAQCPLRFNFTFEDEFGFIQNLGGSGPIEAASGTGPKVFNLNDQDESSGNIGKIKNEFRYKQHLHVGYYDADKQWVKRILKTSSDLTKFVGGMKVLITGMTESPAIIGPPNMFPTYGDDPDRAWGVKTTKWEDDHWFIVEFEYDVYPLTIQIYETFNGGAVLKIYALQHVDDPGVLIYEASSLITKVYGQSRIFQPYLEKDTKTRHCKMLRIHQDLSAARATSQIDAIALYGHVPPLGETQFAQEVIGFSSNRTEQMAKGVVGFPEAFTSKNVFDEPENVKASNNEWLKLEYEHEVIPLEIDVYETFNIGITKKIYAVPIGTEKEVLIWMANKTISNSELDSNKGRQLKAVRLMQNASGISTRVLKVHMNLTDAHPKAVSAVVLRGRRRTRRYDPEEKGPRFPWVDFSAKVFRGVDVITEMKARLLPNYFITNGKETDLCISTGYEHEKDRWSVDHCKQPVFPGRSPNAKEQNEAPYRMKIRVHGYHRETDELKVHATDWATETILARSSPWRNTSACVDNTTTGRSCKKWNEEENTCKMKPMSMFDAGCKKTCKFCNFDGCNENFTATSIGDSCLRVITGVKVTYYRAERYCRKKGAHLVLPDDNFLRQTLPVMGVFPVYGSSYWVGRRDKYVRKGWPAHTVSTSYPALILGSVNAFADPRVERSFVCEHEPYEYKRPDDVVFIDLDENANNYFIAKSLCETRGLSLPQPKNEEELRALNKYTDAGIPFFLGLSEHAKQEYKWDDGEKAEFFMGVSSPNKLDAKQRCVLKTRNSEFDWEPVDCLAIRERTTVVCQLPQKYIKVTPKTQETTPKQAKNICNSKGRYLPMPKSLTENIYLSKFAENKSIETVHLGIKKAKYYGLVWDDGTQFEWTNWKDESNGNFECASLEEQEVNKTRSKWVRIDCTVSVETEHICEAKVCQPGFQLSHGVCIRLFTEKHSWEEANNVCKSYGTRLAWSRLYMLAYSLQMLGYKNVYKEEFQVGHSSTPHLTHGRIDQGMDMYGNEKNMFICEHENKGAFCSVDDAHHRCYKTAEKEKKDSTELRGEDAATPLEHPTPALVLAAALLQLLTTFI